MAQRPAAPNEFGRGEGWNDRHALVPGSLNGHVWTAVCVEVSVTLADVMLIPFIDEFQDTETCLFEVLNAAACVVTPIVMFWAPPAGTVTVSTVRWSRIRC